MYWGSFTGSVSELERTVLNVNIKLDILRTHLEAMLLSLL